jgi:hypothetical protein
MKREETKEETKEVAFKSTRFNSFMIRLTFILVPASFAIVLLNCLAIVFESAAPIWFRVLGFPAAFVWAFGVYVTVKVFWTPGEEIEEDEEIEEENKNTDVYHHLDDYTDSSSHRRD